MVKGFKSNGTEYKSYTRRRPLLLVVFGSCHIIMMVFSIHYPTKIVLRVKPKDLGWRSDEFMN